MFNELCRRHREVRYVWEEGMEADFAAVDWGRTEYISVERCRNRRGWLLERLSGFPDHSKKTLLTMGETEGDVGGVEVGNVIDWMLSVP